MFLSSSDSIAELSAVADKVNSIKYGGSIDRLYGDPKEDQKIRLEIKQGTTQPEDLVNATIHSTFIDFGPAIDILKSALTKLAQPSDAKPVIPSDNLDPEALNVIQTGFSGWDGHSVLSGTSGNYDYVGGPNGEMFVHDNRDGGGDTLVTSNGKHGAATIVTKSSDGVIQATTDDFHVTMRQLDDQDHTKLMTFTTNTVPSISVGLKLKEDGTGYEIVDPNHPDQKLDLFITSDAEIQKFDLLIREMIAAGGAYTFDDFKRDFKKDLSELSDQYGLRAQSQPGDPLLLTLGSDSQPPIAQINGDDGVPIYYNFSDGTASINGLGAAANFVFHDGDGATTGARIFLAHLTKDLSGSRDPERDAQTINDAVNTALAIAQQFLSGGSLDSAAAIGMLQDLYGVLGSINSLAGDLAQSYVSDALGKVHNGENQLSHHPTALRSRVLSEL